MIEVTVETRGLPGHQAGLDHILDPQYILEYVVETVCTSHTQSGEHNLHHLQDGATSSVDKGEASMGHSSTGPYQNAFRAVLFASSRHCGSIL